MFRGIAGEGVSCWRSTRLEKMYSLYRDKPFSQFADKPFSQFADKPFSIRLNFGR